MVLPSSSRRRTVTVAVAASLAVAVLGAGGAPARAALFSGPTSALTPSATPSATPSPGPSAAGATVDPSGPGAGESQPSAEELAALQEAEDLRNLAGTRAGQVQDARTALAEAAAAASAALQRHGLAVRTRQLADIAAADQEAELVQAQLAVATGRDEVGRWAREAYLSGGSLSQSPAVVTLLQGGSTDDIGVANAFVRRVGDNRTRALDALGLAQQERERAATAAEQAALAAQSAAAVAEAARLAKEAALARQRSLLQDAEAELTRVTGAAAQADERARRLAQAREYAAGLAAAHAADLAGGPTSTGVTGPVGDCAGGDLAGLRNGTFPAAALCPLWGAPGHLLRADAAHAFNRLSRAYAARFGRPVCVTDSYRSYEQQVAVYRAKPHLAAVPGTSNHGWGAATDLCAGIQSFGTEQHEWMLLNAPLYGWFHPSWARAGGSKPEPWHWEYGG